MSETFEKISAVLDGVVPPVGGDVEFTQPDFDELEVAEVILAQQGLSNLAGACSTAYAALNSYRTLVTRLQAENAALQQPLNVVDQQNDELTAEKCPLA